MAVLIKLVAVGSGLKADFQSSHEAPRSSLRVLACVAGAI